MLPPVLRAGPQEKLRKPTLPRGGGERTAHEGCYEIPLARALWVRARDGEVGARIERDELHLRELAHEERDQLACCRLPDLPPAAETTVSEEVVGSLPGAEDG